MAIDILVLANILSPLHTATDGMERSTYDLITILAGRRDLKITVVAHPATQLPAGISLVGVEVPSCPTEYFKYGDGHAKWEHIANDCGLLRVISRLNRRAVVHDLSSSVSSCILSSVQGNAVIKTIRLQPAHPSCSLTADGRAWTIYISHFQRNMDRWSNPKRSSVFYDLIPAPLSADGGEPRDSLVSIGRVEPRKGHEAAVRVAQHLGKPLLIIGRIADADFASKLEKASDVTLVGEASAIDVFKHIRQSSGLIWTPAIPEPGGRVVVEALRCGVEVFAVPFGLAADIIEAGIATIQMERIAGLSIYRLRDLPAAWHFTAADVADWHARLYHLVAQSLS
jgi:glycosyltransferase involved in cell wall biosynthesis